MADATPTTLTTGAAPSPEKKGRQVNTPRPLFVNSAEEATKEAANRTTGHRRAYKVSLAGKDYFLVCHNAHWAGCLALEKAGGKVEEIGKAPRAPKAANADGVLAVLNALPEEERKKVLEQLGLTKTEAPAPTPAPAAKPAGKK